MKTIACLALAIMCCLSGCTKSEAEMSQLERELSEPLKENEIIEDGAVRIKLNYQNAQIALEGNLLSVTQPYVNYFIENMPDNSETILYIEFLSGSGTFDLMAEGFTASTYTKRFYMLGLPIGVGKKPFMKIQKGIVKYTFTRL
jgi:hypothetical protein